MSKINVLETAAEKEHREKIEGIVKDYIGWSREILVGQVTPNRVITHIASTYQMTREGVKGILRRRGSGTTTSRTTLRHFVLWRSRRGRRTYRRA